MWMRMYLIAALFTSSCIGAGPVGTSFRGEWKRIPVKPLQTSRELPHDGTAVFFLNDKVGWIVSLGQILHTSDGGKTWSVQFESRSLESARTEGTFTDVTFLDKDNGWVIGGLFSHEAPQAAFVIRTKDGGKNWAREKALDARGTYITVQFMDAKNGWLSRNVLDGESLLKSVDGGETWEEVKVPAASAGFSFVSSKDVYGLNGAGENVLLRTNNAGSDWTRIDLQQQNVLEIGEGSVKALSFIDKEEGWIAALSLRDREDGKEDVILLHTADEGKTWDRRGQKALKGVGWPTAIKFVDKKSGWLVTNSAKSMNIFHTSDGGVTWEKEFSGERISDLFFSSSGSGFAVGLDGFLLRR